MSFEKITIPETGFLRLPDILKLIPVSPATWWKWVKEGSAPGSIKLGQRTTVWRAEDIRAMIERLGAKEIGR